MKNSADICLSILKEPCFSKLREKCAVSFFIQALPPMVKNWILFGYVREKTLFLALKHPAFKQEFYHKKKLIESCLKQFQEEKELLLEVEKIVHFVSYTKYQQHIDEVAKKEIPQTYGELSRGEFKNLATSKEVYRVFEEIREIILKNID